MADQTQPGVGQTPADHLEGTGPSGTEASATPEIATPMLDVHAPHQAVHSWKAFFVHIAAISIGLLLALGLEATAGWVHHRHEAHQARELLRQEVDRNRLILKDDIRLGDAAESNHRAALAVLRRARAGAIRPDDQLVFVRKYVRLNSSAWKVVHESGAGAYIPYEVMARYGEIYETQDGINQAAFSIYADLLKATSVLNTEQADVNRAEEDRLEHAIDAADSHVSSVTSQTDLAVEQKTVSWLSGRPDLSRLSPAQIDRLEQGFQQAVSDDSRLHRMYIYLDDLYAALPK